MTEMAGDIPVLDLGPWLAGERGALEALAADLRSACIEVGFYFIANHGVDQGLIDRTFEQTAALHALPEAVKSAYRINKHNIGYMASKTSMQRSSSVHQATKPNLVASYFMKRDRTADDPAVVAEIMNALHESIPAWWPIFRCGA